uniref:Ig-like domain-containing protein n=1 Tax=Astatotilapia calliptera TaxID=8154 RepID=A0A3P8N5M1_ASTCA
MGLCATQTESSWTVDVPSSVEGLLGSCVVIPCSYNYPDIAAHTFTGIWRIDDQVIYHPTESNTMEKYRGRTKLLGDLSKKNCSLMIENLQQSDGGPFFFRIELEGPNKFSYSNNKVSISMIGEPNPTDFFVQEEVKEGQTVSAFCSVSHSCPTNPPDFHWSHSGEQHFQTQNLQNGQWKATSTLTFRSDRTDNNKPLRCRVTYHGGKQREPSKTIKVKCKGLGSASVTGRSPVQSLGSLSWSLCPWARHFTYCLLVLARGADGAIWQPRFCQSAPGQLWLQL